MADRLKLCVFLFGWLCYLLAYLAVLIVLWSRFIITLTFSWSGFTAWMEHGIGIGLELDGMGMGMGYSMKIRDIQSLL